MGYLNRWQILFIVFILSNTACSTEVKITPTKRPTNMAVTGHNIKGTVFTEKYAFSNFMVSDVSFDQIYTPTKEDIEKAEHILKQQIKALNSPAINQFGSGDLIHKNLPHYFRQYVGMFNNQHQRLIHINFRWSRYTLFNKLIDKIRGDEYDGVTFESDYDVPFDGGSRYWQVNVNLTTNKLSDLQVNGVG